MLINSVQRRMHFQAWHCCYPVYTVEEICYESVGSNFNFSKLESLSGKLGKLQQVISLRISLVRFLRGHGDIVRYKVVIKSST